MTEINDKMTTESPPGTSPTRTQQALDQAAGGSGDIALERTEQDDTAGFRPQHGTDDARCEDSGESDRQRKRTAEDVMSKIANAGTTSSAEKAGEDPLDDGDTSDQE
ncbi:hypothetical protein [Rhizobium lusitanum]|uniref:Uncharacterized protein n=1 Tax=Rhizobium lusitanum TaxID=293958 RepID=A0A7X0IXJ3_9HYPH|nr:hypothetical protein [Rhizobium lusitanum]MBB6488624.1 hypothetical protein [Rhizobium lusitanum]